MGEYAVADKLYGFSIEPGDIIRTTDGQEILVSLVDSVEDGYDIYYTDPFEGEEGVYHLPEDDMVDLLILE
jgi:hypothetical protein